MPVCINILTGGRTHFAFLRSYFQQSDFLHPLWVNAGDFGLFSQHPFLSDIQLKPGQTPCVAKVGLNHRTNSFYNVAQFSNQWKLFAFHLYHRQVGLSRGHFSFSDQIKLQCHANAYKLSEKEWISGDIFAQLFRGEFTTIPSSKGVPLFNRCTSYFTHEPTEFFNISQTNNPHAIRQRMYHSARSPISGKRYPFAYQKRLCEISLARGYRSDFWINEQDISKLHRFGVKLQYQAEGTAVEKKNGARDILYHTEQTSNPLRLQKALNEHNYISQSCVDFLTGKQFSPADLCHLIRFRCVHNFHARKWIRNTDLPIFGAIVCSNQKDNFVKLHSDMWYNLDQLINTKDVVRAQLQIRRSIHKNDQSSLQLFADILGGKSLPS
ncbi:aldehyde dehydrogenase [Perkinsela sp. CCAP 1560/4]|nr:aldehyde dehydrogenase [Perkinsela sp. CCAP 1560/4]|eukprot:KNH07909.1 aldehyde dehydrogenase [Perkinsela sp. CCAP 1560/4]